ncbi:MAG: hypothetical protein AABW56_00835 [Nanoarchaeota archaeon]
MNYQIKQGIIKAINFAEKYWDLAACFASPIAFNDVNNEVFGNLRELVILSGPLALLYASYKPKTSEDRLLRNMCMGISGLFYSWQNRFDNVPITSKMMYDGIALFFGIGSLKTNQVLEKEKYLEDVISTQTN